MTDATFSRYDVSGTLDIDRGGTGVTSFTDNAILYGDGLGNPIDETNTLADAVLVTNGSSVPSLSTTLPANLTIPTPTISGDTTYDNAGNDLTLSVASQTGTATVIVPDLGGTSGDIVVTNATQTISNKLLEDSSTTIFNNGDVTTGFMFEAGGIAGGSVRTLTVQDKNGTIALLSDVTGLITKEPARAKTIAALPTYTKTGSGVGAYLEATANGPLPAIDGVTLIVNDRILVNSDGSSSDVDNGIYTVTSLGSAGTPWRITRATDLDEDNEYVANVFIFIEEGTICADTGWVVNTNNPIIVDTTATTWIQFSSAGIIIAGAGLFKTGNTIDVIGSTNSIQVNAGNIQVKSSTTINEVLLSSGATVNEPSWGALPLNDSNAVTGTLPVNLGGTGNSSYTAGDILVATGATTLGTVNATARRVLTTNAANSVNWRNDIHVDNILDQSDNELLSFNTTASAVNEVTIANAATGDSPKISATGETNVGLELESKGTEAVYINRTGTAPGEIRILDEDNSAYVGISVPNTVTNYTITLPDNSNTVIGQVLQATDTSGTLEWATPTPPTGRDFHIEDNRIRFNTTSTLGRLFAYFAWDASDVGGGTTRTLTFYYDSTNRIGEIILRNETTSAILNTFTAGTDFTDTDGIKTVTFADIGTDTLLGFRGRKTLTGGTNPSVYGVRLTIS